MKKLVDTKKYILIIWSTAACLFHLYTAWAGVLPPLQQRSIHLLFLLPLVFVLYPSTKSKENKMYLFLDTLLLILSFISTIYIIINYQSIDKRLLYVDVASTTQIILGTIALVLVVEATRRSVAPAMAIITVIFTIYIFIAPYLPGMFYFHQIRYSRFIEMMYLFQDSGIFGMITGVSATYVFIFVLFATLINSIGLGELFINIAKKLTGRTIGGPAKVAVLSSALFGSISGISTANVYATGSFTIPMMKNLGYNKSFAGAVEAAASTGGLILPPIMGVGAFVIAELTGNSYYTVCKAAILPALIYYFGIFVMVHFQSIRDNLRPLADETELPSWKTILFQLPLAFPIVILIIFLVMRMTAYNAAFYSVIACVVVIILRKETRRKWFNILINSFVIATKNALIVAMACTCAGIIVSILTFSGIGVEISSNLIRIAGGNLLVALFLIMISSIILGMGLPCTPAYIIAVSVGGPALMKLGVGIDLLTAHLFVYYFAILAAITPPVCIVSYAAATIAQASPLEVGIKGMKLAFAGFIVPYIFIMRGGSLLFQTSLLDTIIDFILVLVTVLLIAIGIYGYWRSKLSILARSTIICVGIVLSFKLLNVF